MLYGKLEALYKANPVLEQRYPLGEYYPLLRKFISSEVSLGAEYLSPYRFALSYYIAPSEAIRLFIGLTDDSNILTQCYKYQCDECDAINIIKDEDSLREFLCKRCGFEDSLTRKEYLSEVKILFKLSNEILEDVEKSLKSNPLSSPGNSVPEVLERGDDKEVTLGMLEDAIYDENGNPISPQAEATLKRFQTYRAIAEGAV